MTATTARLLPVQPGRVRNALLNTLGRHGVSRSTAESIWLDLTTGQDPRPADVPETVIYRGIRVDWPRGRHTRPLHPSEIRQINMALRSVPVRNDQLLDSEDTAEAGRHAVEWLHAHKSHPKYNPEPVRAAQLRELVEEATEARRAESEPILVHEGDEHEPEVNIDCAEINPKGDRLCTEAHGHDGQHRNQGVRWGKRERVFAQEVAQEISTEDANAILTGEPVELCAVPGPYGTTCQLTPHEGDEHNGFGYAWTGEQASEPVSEPVGCPFERDECLAMQDAGEGECDEHEPPTREELIAAAQRTSVEIVLTPERPVTAQAVPLEPTTDIDALLAELHGLSERLGA